MGRGPSLPQVRPPSLLAAPRHPRGTSVAHRPRRDAFPRRALVPARAPSVPRLTPARVSSPARYRDLEHFKHDLRDVRYGGSDAGRSSGPSGKVRELPSPVTYPWRPFRDYGRIARRALPHAHRRPRGSGVRRRSRPGGRHCRHHGDGVPRRERRDRPRARFSIVPPGSTTPPSATTSPTFSTSSSLASSRRTTWAGYPSSDTLTVVSARSTLSSAIRTSSTASRCAASRCSAIFSGFARPWGVEGLEPVGRQRRRRAPLVAFSGRVPAQRHVRAVQRGDVGDVRVRPRGDWEIGAGVAARRFVGREPRGVGDGRTAGTVRSLRGAARVERGVERTAGELVGGWLREALDFIARDM